MDKLAQQIITRDDNLSRIIDRVLTQVFGKQATLLIYKHLERNYSVKRNEVAEKLELFTRGLEDFLKSGANAIERKILEDIWSSYGSEHKIHLEQPKTEGSFVSEIKLILQEA